MKKFYAKICLLIFLALFWRTISSAQTTLAEWNFPSNPDNATVDISIPANSAAAISTVGGTSGVTYNQVGATTNCANATIWTAGSGVKWWETNISTSTYVNLQISSKQFSSPTGPRDFKIQYKIGAGGVWTDVPGATAIVCAGNFTSGVVTNVALPAACDNQASVYFRWIMTSNINVGGGAIGAAGNSRIDDIQIVSLGTPYYFRSIASGNWGATSTWESSTDNITWAAAATTPYYGSNTVTIRSPHVVIISSSVTVDDVTVDFGGTLVYQSATLTFNDGPGIDLQINGTMVDSSANSTVWPSASTTWILGAAATYIKSSGGSNVWSSHYSGGISTIPATANWYLRYTGNIEPTMTSGSLAMYYPNLTIESVNGGLWTTLAANISGFLNFVTIKGNLDIGGTQGLGTVNFLTNNTNAQPTIVMGNTTIRSGSTLRNNGTGFELQGNLQCDGTISYSTATASPTLNFNGAIAQSISGAGTLGVYKMTVNKSANDLTLNGAITVDNVLTFTNGRIFSSATNLLNINTNGSVTGMTNASFTHGPVRYVGPSAFTFPVGKSTSYQPLGISASVVGGGGIFWTETFENSCSANCLASGFSGVNGAWTETNGTNESAANEWWVSCAEVGHAATECGSACSFSCQNQSDASMHVSVNPSWGGDVGAAYGNDGAFSCTLLSYCVATDKRMDSPTINCSGKSTITISFNYIEGGDGTNDNATFWYYDGATWTQLDDMIKTSTCTACDGTTGQGLWTAYSFALPASANNNANVKIGFRWVNNADGAGTDPSFALDDITLSSPGSFPVVDFTSEYFIANPQTTFNNVLAPTLTHISNCEYWDLVRNAGTENKNVTLSWTAGNACPNSDAITNLRVARWDTTMWQNAGNTATSGNAATGTVTSTTQTAFGHFTLAATPALPVTLISFTAEKNNNDALLKWTTASEINNDYFEILSSTSASSQSSPDFVQIGRVKGNGNSTQLHSYNFVDHRSGKSGTYYYRLRQVDYDGRQSFSNIAALRFGSGTNLNLVGIIPNPYTDHTSVQIYSDVNSILKAQVFDLTGRELSAQTFAIDKGIFTFDPEEKNSLVSGIYFIRVTLDDESITSRLVKQ